MVTLLDGAGSRNRRLFVVVVLFERECAARGALDAQAEQVADRRTSPPWVWISCKIRSSRSDCALKGKRCEAKVGLTSVSRGPVLRLCDQRLAQRAGRHPGTAAQQLVCRSLGSTGRPDRTSPGRTGGAPRPATSRSPGPRR